MRICGVKAQATTKDAKVMPFRFPTNTPSWCVQVDLKPFTNTQLRQYIADALGSWSKVCGCNPVEVTDPSLATVLMIGHDFGDGPSGVLADCELPTGVRQQKLRWDIRTNWAARGSNTKTGFIEVTSHEWGHAKGFYHLPIGGLADLMEPYYRQGLWEPQAFEAAIAREAYGPPTTPTPMPPNTSITVQGFTINFSNPTTTSIKVALDVQTSIGKYPAVGDVKKQ